MHTLKRIMQISSTGILSFCLASVALASEEDQRQTAFNTTAILQKVSNLPNYLNTLSQFAVAMIEPDTSDATADAQTNFTALGNLLIQDNATQDTLQMRLNDDLLKGTTQANLPYANDLIYSSILGKLKYNPDPRGSGVTPQYNYIENASGLTISNVVPNPSWQGSPEAQVKYAHYYNTMMAIKSYGGYILSNQYADGKQFSDLQTLLIKQASDPSTWFAKIASENIGWVFRQLLMYQSQSFVLMTQLVQTQRQMVAAQVMTNAAIVATASLGDQNLIKAAQSTS